MTLSLATQPHSGLQLFCNCPYCMLLEVDIRLGCFENKLSFFSPCMNRKPSNRPILGTLARPFNFHTLLSYLIICNKIFPINREVLQSKKEKCSNIWNLHHTLSSLGCFIQSSVPKQKSQQTHREMSQPVDQTHHLNLFLLVIYPVKKKLTKTENYLKNIWSALNNTCHSSEE